MTDRVTIRDRAPRLSPQRWIGMAHVRPRPGNDALGDAKVAFVVSIAWADSVRDYSEQVTAVLNNYDFDVLEIEDIETLGERLKTQGVAAEIHEVAITVTENNHVALATFHAFSE